MNNQTKATLYFILSLLSAIVFAATAYAWGYYINVVTALPAGLLSLLFTRLGKKIDLNPKKYNFIYFILLIGVVVSLIFLIYIIK